MSGKDILLNMFLAIVLQNFERGNAKSTEKPHMSLKEKQNLLENLKCSEMWRVIFACRRRRSAKVEHDSVVPACDMNVEAVDQLRIDRTFGELMVTNSKHDRTSECMMKDVKDHCCSSLPLYKWIAATIQNKWFDRMILVMIILSSMALAWEHPNMDPNSLEYLLLGWANIIFTLVFLVELILKVYVLGLFGAKDAYLASAWNCLDAFIVIVSLVDLMNPTVDVSILKLFRFLRMLRPFRVISRSEGMRVVFNALLRSIPAMCNVLVVMFVAWLIFGILSVQLYRGRFYSCSKSDASITDRASCIAAAHQWKNAVANFDNIFNAMLTLFEVATLEGWPNIMFAAIDATDVDSEPILNNAPASAMFFMTFIFLGSFFLLSLFAGVVYDNFTKLRDEYSGLALLTPEQRVWVQAQALVLGMKPVVKAVKPDLPITHRFKWMIVRKAVELNGRMRQIAFEIVSLPQFEQVIMFCIVMNVVLMASTYSGEPSGWTQFIEIGNDIFTFIFCLEALIKLWAFYPRLYFRDPWNKFDFTIVVGSLLEALITGIGQRLGNLKLGTLIRLLRIFRVSRLLRIVKSSKSLKSLLRTLLLSLPSLANVGTLLILMYFVYALVGVKLFGTVVRQSCIDDRSNFETFPSAILTLFRVSTGENWNCLMHDCMRAEMGGSSFAWVYFISFILIVTFITLNLFIAVILDNFAIVIEKTDREEEDPPNNDTIITIDAEEVPFPVVSKKFAGVTESLMGRFNLAWSHYDPLATRYIPVRDFMSLLRELTPPLGLGRQSKTADVLRLVQEIEVPIHKNETVHYGEVLFVLTKRLVGKQIPSSQIQRDLRRKMSKAFPSKRASSQRFMNAGVYISVVRAQQAWKRKASGRSASAGQRPKSRPTEGLIP